MPESELPSGPPITNEVGLADVTAQDPNATVPVRTASGVVEAAKAPVQRDAMVPGEAVYSDGHCPLLVDDADIDNRTVTDGVNPDGTPVVLRYSQQLVTTPTKCPTCAKVVERHQLVWTNDGQQRDCAIALASRSNARYKRLYELFDSGAARSDIAAEASRHGAFGDRFMRVFFGAPAETPQEVNAQPVAPLEATSLSAAARAHQKWLADGQPDLSTEDWEARVRAESGDDAEPNSTPDESPAGLTSAAGYFIDGEGNLHQGDVNHGDAAQFAPSLAQKPAQEPPESPEPAPESPAPEAG